MKLKFSFLCLLTSLSPLVSVAATPLVYSGNIGLLTLLPADNTLNNTITFNSATGYFPRGNQYAINPNIILNGTGFTWNSGIQTSSYVFNGSLTGTGNFTKTGSSSNGMDFLFLGDISQFQGNFNINASYTATGTQDTVGSSRIGILQFGNNTIPNLANTATITGTGSITSSGLVWYQYTGDVTVANSLIKTQYLDLKGTGNITFTNAIQGYTAGNYNSDKPDTIVINAGQIATFNGSITNMDAITIKNGASATFNQGIQMGNGYLLDIQYGSTATINAASAFAQLAVSGTLNLNTTYTKGASQDNTIIGSGTINLGGTGSAGSFTHATIKNTDLAGYHGTLKLVGGHLTGSTGATTDTIVWDNNRPTLSSSGITGVAGSSRGGLIDANFKLAGGGIMQFNLDSTGTSDIGSFSITGAFSAADSSSFSFNLSNPTALATGNYLLLSTTAGFGNLSFTNNKLNLSAEGYTININGLTNSANSRVQKYFYKDGNNLYLNVSQSNLKLTWAPATGDSLVWKSGAEADADTAKPWKSQTDGSLNHAFLQADEVLFNDTSTNKTIDIQGAVDPSLMTVDTTSSYSFSSSNNTGDITGAQTKIVKTGTGTLTLNLANTYGGGTDINGGTLIAQKNNALGTGTVNIALGATLELNAGEETITLNNVRTGAGTLSKTGTGTAVLNGNSTRTGLTWIKAGVLQVNSAQSLGAGNITIETAGTLIRDTSTSNETMASSVTLSGAGVFTKTGAGTLNMLNTGTNFSGTLNVNEGILSTLSDNALGSANVHIKEGAALAAAANFTQTSSKTFENNGDLYVHGTSDTTTVTLSTVTGSGKITVIKGTLNGNNSDLGGNSLVIKGGTLKNINTPSTLKTIIDLSASDVPTFTKLDNIKMQAAIKTFSANEFIQMSGNTSSLVIKNNPTLGDNRIAISNQSISAIEGTPITTATGKIALNDSSNVTFTGTLSLDLNSISWSGNDLANLETNGTSIFSFLLVDKGSAGTITTTDLSNIILTDSTGLIKYKLTHDVSTSITELHEHGTVSVTASIPEPSTVTLSILALAGLMLRRRRIV